MATTRQALRQQKTVDFDQKSKSKARTKANASNKGPKKTPRGWEGQEWCTLLAHLEWSDKVKKDFWNEGFPRFNKAVGSPFPRNQVRGKLRREWGDYGRKTGQNTYNDAFERGLKAFDLPDDAMDRVKPPLDSPHDSESSSGNPSIEVATPRHEKERDGHQATTKGATRKPRRIVRLRTSPRNLRASGNRSKANPDVIEVMDSEDELTSYLPPDDATTRRNEMLSQRAETPGTQILIDAIESKDKEMASLKNRIFSMENEKARLNDEIKELRRCNPDAEVKRRLEKMFDDLQAKSQRNLSFDMDKRGLQKERIVQSYETLYRNIHDACLDLVLVDGELPAQDFGFYYTAQSWAHKTFNQDIGRCIRDINMGRLSKLDVLMGLITRAVIERVFVPAFPNVLSTPSPMAEFYRNEILSYNGPDELHKVDLTSLFFLMHYRKSEILEIKERDLLDAA
ncbi:hypothetical protein NW762_010867 [Fusarium torreyae]|uniref:Uncharacterized protein n=1 Tax=Fusarium torreyae TaxID=1237075 RepID=A0A9W8RR58_9HYPO|nr:hypothetical protein NW762_010867 [Fusarium torreyae]